MRGCVVGERTGRGGAGVTASFSRGRMNKHRGEGDRCMERNGERGSEGWGNERWSMSIIKP